MPPSIVKALSTGPSSLSSSTEGKDNFREVVVAVVLAHRADLPQSVKTRPRHVRTDLSPQLSEELKLLLITEHYLASRNAVEVEHEFRLGTPKLLLDMLSHAI